MSASRSSRRSARLAASALFVGFAALVAVSACSSGQISQTSRQVSAVPGAALTIGNPATEPSIELRDMVVVYNGEQGYPQGGSAPLVVRIFNTGPTAVSLVKVTATDAATTVVLTGGATTIPTAAAGSTPTVTPSGKASGSASASAGASSSAKPTQTVARPAGQATFSINVPPAAYALLVPGQGQYLQLSGLKSGLTPGQSVRVTFTFADGRSGTVQIPVGVPIDTQPRPTGRVDVNSVEGQGTGE